MKRKKMFHQTKKNEKEKHEKKPKISEYKK